MWTFHLGPNNDALLIVSLSQERSQLGVRSLRGPYRAVEMVSGVERPLVARGNRLNRIPKPHVAGSLPAGEPGSLRGTVGDCSGRLLVRSFSTPPTDEFLRDRQSYWVETGERGGRHEDRNQ
jgi:hypothetical protein